MKTDVGAAYIPMPKRGGFTQHFNKRSTLTSGCFFLFSDCKQATKKHRYTRHEEKSHSVNDRRLFHYVLAGIHRMT